MTDVRSLLKNERASRRIQHKHASYSTGTLLCIVCHLQLKSESLWDGHLRSAGHLIRLKKLEDQENEPALPTNTEPIPSKKRKASDDDEDGTIHKKNKPANGIPEGFFDAVPDLSPTFPNEMQIPSRPATPLKPAEVAVPQIDEDEWAAFKSDIAIAEAQVAAANDAVISAPAMSVADIAKKSADEDYIQRKERQEAELEGDKEDTARKLEEELEVMESLEARVKRLRDKREELRRRGSYTASSRPVLQPVAVDAIEEDDEEEEDEAELDDWIR